MLAGKLLRRNEAARFTADASTREFLHPTPQSQHRTNVSGSDQWLWRNPPQRHRRWWVDRDLSWKSTPALNHAHTSSIMISRVILTVSLVRFVEAWATAHTKSQSNTDQHCYRKFYRFSLTNYGLMIYKNAMIINFSIIYARENFYVSFTLFSCVSSKILRCATCKRISEKSKKLILEEMKRKMVQFLILFRWKILEDL